MGKLYVRLLYRAQFVGWYFSNRLGDRIGRMYLAAFIRYWR